MPVSKGLTDRLLAILCMAGFSGFLNWPAKVGISLRSAGMSAAGAWMIGGDPIQVDTNKTTVNTTAANVLIQKTAAAIFCP